MAAALDEDTAAISRDITQWRATEIARRVRGGHVTPIEVLQAHLRRIEVMDRSIAAFQVVRAERALDEARQLERRSDLAMLPLAGVPVAVKDNVDVAGEPTRAGSSATSPRAAAEDDELVKRLKHAGCIVIGKTRMPELAIWPLSESAAFGVTRNPWNLERTAGGSTSGGGAAVAARMAPVAIGSDGGGSIRVPSACCGTFGLKPGPGIIPLAGGMSDHWCGMTEFGPLARNATDLAALFDVLSGSRGAQPDDASRPGRLRIAVSTKHPVPGARVDGEVRTAVERMAKHLADAGHEVSRANPPYPADLGVRFSRRWLPGIARDAESSDPNQLEPRTRSMVRVGNWLRRKRWDAPASADSLGARMATWFGDYDLLMTPTVSVPAPSIEKWRGQGWVRTTFGVANWLFTTPWNLARFPAASVPCGLSSDGLPIGLQLVAPPGHERRLLAVAAHIEELCPPALPPG